MSELLRLRNKQIKNFHQHVTKIKPDITLENAEKLFERLEQKEMEKLSIESYQWEKVARVEQTELEMLSKESYFIDEWQRDIQRNYIESLTKKNNYNKQNYN